jgi:DNA mismatch repair protein MutL
VRFADAGAVADAVEAAVRGALSGTDLARDAATALDLDDGFEPAGSRFEDVELVGQFRELYLLCEADGDLLVIDQHAAHERVTYERLREQAGEGVESLPVDPPATLSLSPPAAAALEEAREAVAALGFAVEGFGGDTYRVTAVPAPLGRAADDPADALRDVLDGVLAGETPADPREALLADLACHPSLKAGDELVGEDAGDLVAALGACEQPYACPHGRPTVLRVDEATLARGFDRPNTRLD